MILDTIIASTRKRVEAKKSLVSFDTIKKQAQALTAAPPSFYQALNKQGLSLICEVKKASPSKGVISQDFPYMQIASAYEKGGASAISVLTEPEFFLGSPAYLKEIAAAVKIPVLMKDFVLESYQIYEARALGASAVLLICGVLSEAELREHLKLAHSLKLDCLCEVHSAAELEIAAQSGARIIGVNNRNLKDFTVDIGNALAMKAKAPQGVIFVAESGIQTIEDIQSLKSAGIDAALIGEAFMRAEDIEARVREFNRA
ncbi:MAG: indole-3-glycerol phosphate synthase TrpC [Oscillospiraceae bacterium]|jgi:indole-3-glycerol phosphate synthase|nr:indole-3-glycerol phosphate synthase TrpC [Oscillospiraceae bacterium]